MEKYTTEHIEQYLENTLSESERKIMEQELAASPELREEVKLQQVVVKNLQRQALKNLVQEAHIRNSGNGGSFYKWFFGAVLLAALLAGSYFLAPEKQATQEKKQATVAQTPATDKKEAEVWKHVDVPFASYSFQAEKGITVKDERSGAVISIPANALQNKDGKPVKGNVSLNYREFRTKADFALAGIPMTYKDKNFNSAGMFELRVFHNKDTLQLITGKTAGVEFNMTKNEPGIGFYYLSQPENEWVLLESLDKKVEARVEKVADTIGLDEVIIESLPVQMPLQEQVHFAGKSGKEKFVEGLNQQLELSGNRKKSAPVQPEENVFKKGPAEDQTTTVNWKMLDLNSPSSADTIDTRNINKSYPSNLSELENSVGNTGNFNEENTYQAARLIMTREELKMSKEEWYAYIKGNEEVEKRIRMHLDSVASYGKEASKYIQGLAQKTNNRLAEIRQAEYKEAQAMRDSLNRVAVDKGTLDAGHYFDPLVRNLSISGFGVFNCDQVYRIKSPARIQASYKDEQGKEIRLLRALSVIDTKVNGVFSFDPKNFTCSSTGNTNLLLFTKDNRIFFLNTKGWHRAKVVRSGKYVFTMKEISEQVKTPEDLQAILENQSSI